MTLPVLLACAVFAVIYTAAVIFMAKACESRDDYDSEGCPW